MWARHKISSTASIALIKIKYQLAVNFLESLKSQNKTFTLFCAISGMQKMLKASKNKTEQSIFSIEIRNKSINGSNVLLD